MAKTAVYEIAKYIPLKIRKQMVAVEYKLRRSSGVRECADGKCPMGWLPVESTRPWPRQITNWAMDHKGWSPWNEEKWDTVFDAAHAFTTDFDDGKIKDLRKALGVPK